MDKNALIKISIISIIIGILVGFFSDLFIRAMQIGSKFLWEDLIPNAKDHSLAVIGITISGGLLMGLCVKYFGVNKGIGFEAVMDSVKTDGELGVKQLKRVVLNTYFGLITGASVGPEAPLITIGGFLGDKFGRLLKVSQQQVMAFIAISLGGSIGILLNTPVAGPIMYAEKPPTDNKNTNTLLIFTSMVAASIGFGIYVLMKGTFLESMTLVPAYSGFKPIHLLYGFLIGLVGMVIGIAMKTLIEKLKIFWAKYVPWPVWRGIIVGLLLGIVGVIWPLSMFDGSAQLSQLVNHTAEYSIATLIVLVIARIISTGIALSGGYQGGNIFPTLFAAGAAGLAINAMFGSVPAAVAVVACMSSAMFIFIPLPLFTIFLITEISSFSLMPVMAMSLFSAYFARILLSKPVKEAVTQKS